MAKTTADEGRCYLWDDQTELPESFGDKEIEKIAVEVFGHFF